MTKDELTAKGFVETSPGAWIKGSPGAARVIMTTGQNPISDSSPAKRVRQSGKPLMNKLETEFFNRLSPTFPNYPRPRAQAKRYKIANGAWYKPDITATSWPQEVGPDCETAWECKGPDCMKNVARGKLAIKCAAAQWPEVAFYLVWKKDGQWKQQRVLP